MRQSRGRRLVRGASAASIATFAALVSHVSAGGAMPTWLGLGVPLVLSFMVCTVLAGRRMSLVRTAVSVALSQALFHALFVLGASNVLMTEMTHDHSTMVHSSIISAGATAALYGDTTMWAGHAFAALLTILAIRRGELALRSVGTAAAQVFAWLRRRIAALVCAPVLTRPRTAFRASTAQHHPLLHRVVRRAPRRGPPLIVPV